MDPDRRGRLEPDGLPDSCRAVVVDLLRDPADRLLAAWLAGILSVLDAHSDTVLTQDEIGSDIEGEGDMAATVVTDLLAIHPDDRPVVDSTEMKKQIAS